MRLSLIAFGIFVFTSALYAQRSLDNSRTQHGNIVHDSYLTNIGRGLPRGLEEYYVYTPPGYDSTAHTKYPVLYLLHGFKQNALWWVNNGGAKLFLDEQTSKGSVRPMIVVMPACYGDYQFVLKGLAEWIEKAKIEENEELFSRMLLEEIVPRIESTYKVSKRREDRAIAGLSMGGREAIFLGLRNAKEFAWVGGFSAAFAVPFRYQFILPSPHDTQFNLFWVGYGIDDHDTKWGNEQFIAAMNAKGFEVKAVPTPGKHDASVWRDDFQRFVPLLFQPK